MSTCLYDYIQHFSTGENDFELLDFLLAQHLPKVQLKD